MRAPGCTLFLLIAHFTVISCDYVLIPMGSQWSFDDTGADRITQQYQSVTYDASSWQTGNGILGYGYTGISTTISSGTDVMAKIIRFGIARCWLFGAVCTCSSRTAWLPMLLQLLLSKRSYGLRQAFDTGQRYDQRAGGARGALFLQWNRSVSKEHAARAAHITINCF